jgi:hypothetical protein
MKKMIFPGLFVLAILFTSGTAFGQPTTKETRDVKGFNKVSFGVAGNLIINFGPEFRLSIEGDRRIVDETRTEVSGDRLVIKRDNWRMRMSFNDEKVTVYVTMPELRGLGVSGSGRAEVSNPIKNADELSLNVSGSGKIMTAAVSADRLSCGISGSGDIKLGSGGSIDNGDISISGSGTYSGEDVEIDHLKVSVSGSGNCYCRAGDSLDAGVSGSGDVYYSGNPRVNARVSGSGHVRSR